MTDVVEWRLPGLVKQWFNSISPKLCDRADALQKRAVQIPLLVTLLRCDACQASSCYAVSGMDRGNQVQVKRMIGEVSQETVV